MPDTCPPNKAGPEAELKPGLETKSTWGWKTSTQVLVLLLEMTGH